MTWFRVDCGLARNAKILALIAERDGFRAAFAYVCGLGYAREQGTDGFIPVAALPFIHARQKDADMLVSHRLWREQAAGWIVPDWAEYQPVAAEELERGESARRAGLYGNHVRWKHPPECKCWKE